MQFRYPGALVTPPLQGALLWVLLSQLDAGAGLSSPVAIICIIALLVLGMIGMVLSVVVLHDVVGEVGERVGTVLSAAVLIAGHYRNYRLCRTHDCEHDHS